MNEQTLARFMEDVMKVLESIDLRISHIEGLINEVDG